MMQMRLRGSPSSLDIYNSSLLSNFKLVRIDMLLNSEADHLAKEGANRNKIIGRVVIIESAIGSGAKLIQMACLTTASGISPSFPAFMPYLASI